MFMNLTKVVLPRFTDESIDVLFYLECWMIMGQFKLVARVAGIDQRMEFLFNLTKSQLIFCEFLD